MYTCWMVDQYSKTQILNIFGQKHPDLIGHHITYMFGKQAVLPNTAIINLIGHCITETIECFIAEIDGSVVRPDGGIYHLTWSLDKAKGAKPVDSNRAIETNGFKHLTNPISIKATPKLVTF